MLHTLPQHHLVEYLSAGLSNEAVELGSVSIRNRGRDSERTTRPSPVGEHVGEDLGHSSDSTCPD